MKCVDASCKTTPTTLVKAGNLRFQVCDEHVEMARQQAKDLLGEDVAVFVGPLTEPPSSELIYDPRRTCPSFRHELARHLAGRRL